MMSGQQVAASNSGCQRRFQLILIKPSHYDEHGYVIQWAFSWLMSNTLAVLRGLAVDITERQVLGPNVAIDTTTIDETISRVRIEDILQRVERHSGFAMVGLVGVQSNEFPRAIDIARPLRAAGIPVIIGGFHVSGCLSMLPELPEDLQEALNLGVSLFAGEAEGRFDDILRDAAAGALKPVYNFVNDLVSLEFGPEAHRGNTRRTATEGDLRGCRARMSVPMFLLHDYQRSRTQIPIEIVRRYREHSETVLEARQTKAFHHRRQLCPQPRLGIDTRSDHLAAATRKHKIPFVFAG